jgi:hypothetical protein
MQTPDYRAMDTWSSEQVAEFRDAWRDRPPADSRAPRPQLVAEGDSWFDYLPGTDIITCLRQHHGYDIDNYAQAGDTLENMIFGTGIDRRFQRTAPTIETVLRRVAVLKPRVLLFSGGGNDVAGDMFDSYINHRDSGLPALREGYLDTMVNVVFFRYFESLVARVSAVSADTVIVAHGYGHTAPTGESVSLLGFRFAGPWLRPALARKGVFDPVEQRRVVFQVIDAFNTMLAKVAQRHEGFVYVDLRGVLDPDRDWVNELHLRNSAYARVADEIHRVIVSLRQGALVPRDDAGAAVGQSPQCRAQPRK